MQDAERKLLTLLMPEGLLGYFDIMEVVRKDKGLHIHLDEKNIALRKLPYDSPLLKDNEVDIAFIANTYHHIENRTEYFSKVKKGLKTNGQLVIVDFFKAAFTEKVQAPAMTMSVSVDEIVFELKRQALRLLK